jgi:hypothetical protein
MSDLLILAPDAWKDTIKPFLNYKNDVGIPAKMRTLGEIETKFQGRDLPEQIKRAIDSEYRTQGVRYVMLVGDIDAFPVRYIRAVNTEWGTKFYPSDLYYGDLYDGQGVFNDWDFDNDGLFAETDFTGGDLLSTNIDKINMIPDVAIGRVPASNVTELGCYLEKVMRYEFEAAESREYGYGSKWFPKAIFVQGSGFGHTAIMNSWSSVIGQAGISTDKLYEDVLPWSQAVGADRTKALSKRLNDGAGFLVYYGHGNRMSFSGWFDSAAVRGLDNDHRLPVIVAVSCYTGRFHFDRDNYQDSNGQHWIGGQDNRPVPADIQPSTYDRESFAEEFLVKNNTGAVAYIGSVSKAEQGMGNLVLYLLEGYRDRAKPPILGTLWQDALRRFALQDAQKGMPHNFYSYIHLHKAFLFGDPSLWVGGRPIHLVHALPGKIGPEVISEVL